MRVEPEDLTWWLGKAPTLDWIWAKTYASFAPHNYVVHPRSSGMTLEDYQRAAHTIHTFGTVGRFHKHVQVYLEHGQYRYWTMHTDLDNTNLINRAVNDRVYGLQDRPFTFHQGWTEFDPVATRWDKENVRDEARDQELVRRVFDHFGLYRPTVLDIGAGTGAVLDLGITDPQRYTAVDPSQAMLNALIRKHEPTARALAARFDEIPTAFLSPSYELVVALDVPGLSEADVQRMHSLASGLAVIL